MRINNFILIQNFNNREMLTSALRALVKETNLEVLHWEMIKCGMFHFIKVKKVLFLMKIFYFYVS